MNQSEYLKFITEQQGLLDPFTMLSTTVSGVGNMMDSVSEQNDKLNTGRPDLSEYVVGNSWNDIFNNNDRLRQGLDVVQSQQKDYSNVKNNNNLLNTWNSNDLQDNLNYQSPDFGQVFGDVLSDTGKYAGIGATIGSVVPGIGTAIGAGVGALTGVVSGIVRGGVGNILNNNNISSLNAAIDRTNKEQIDNFYNTAITNQQRQQRKAMMNYFDNGGYLDELNGVTKFNVGGSHEQNDFGGIQQGIASDGYPNLVEESEVKYKDYIYSARLKPSKSLLNEFNLPEKYAGKTFAELAEILQKESKDRPNDPVSLQTLNDWMSRLAGAQEEYKAKQEERRLAKAVDSMSNEEKAALLSSLAQPMAQQEGIDLSQPMYKSGGKIFIKPSHRGRLTELKKRTGKTEAELWKTGSPATRKMITFARNARKWKHADGGHLFSRGGFTPTINGFGETIFPQWNLDIDYSKLGDDIKYYPTINQLNSGLDFNTLYNYNKAMNSNIQVPTFVTTPKTEDTVNTDLLTRRLGESLRYAPALGAALGALEARLQSKDYALANELRDIASQYQPISAPHIGGYRRYTPYDVNLGDVENIALTARALEANRGQNRATQGALNTAVLNAAQKTAAQRNLAAQQANEANRLATDTYNLGIDQFNAQRDTQYDQLNQQILNNRLRTLMSAAQAEDDSRTAWAQNINGTTENMYNQLGNVGRDNWARNQRDIYLRDLGYDPVALLSLLNLNRG